MKAALPLFVLAAAALAGCGNGKTAVDPVRPVLTQVVSPGALATRDTYSGEVRARHETDLAFRVAGKIIARPVDAGARVARGQVLARLDPVDAKLAADASHAQLASAESDHALAKAELDRHADLLNRKFISQSSFDAKQNAYNAAKAKLEQSRSQAAITTNQADYTTLVADADGVVISVSAEPGQVVAAGQPVLRLARSGEKEIVINAPENQVTRFKPGQDVMVQLWADASLIFPGKVREIAGGADPVTRTYTVKVTAINPPDAAQLGMTANVAFKAGADSELVLLPLSALARDKSDPAVWIVEPKSGKVQLRAVKVGQFREDGVTITKGLAAGDRVVIAGVHKLRPEQVVRVAN
ncbi:efflux RND transporter periplasmic adaptor subunit [Usitatibacter palustris]|uniref:Macrolide export protein MacA n=1 Tax=Usitatibacter palustris TaxID=2732487 RepID=A0A6M4H7G8_9PROT|nr:efflux RND transporter periplasmic adaptor subunit [Usitatibacter palustris]QJR15589.1 Macrolide export protein MacA [Usitatibacter palustris]